MKKVLWKDIKKSLLKSKGRFFSIFSLMMLGSFALVGLKVTSPDMMKASEKYFNKLNLADIFVLSDYGIDKSDVNILNGVKDKANIEYGYFKDVEIKGTVDSIRVISNPESISRFEIEQGRKIMAENEIVISDNYKGKYKIGDSIIFSEKKGSQGDYILKRHSFKIVGFVKSPEYISYVNMGPSNAGTGELSGYAFVYRKNFNSNYYMMARIKYDDTKGLDPYSKEYLDIVQTHKKDIEEKLKYQPQKRLEEIKNKYKEKIDSAQIKIDNAKKELSDKEIALQKAEVELDNGRKKIASSESKLKDANSQLYLAKNELNNKKEEYERYKQELSTKSESIAAKKSELNEAKVKYESSISELDANINAIRGKMDMSTSGDVANYSAQIESLSRKKESIQSAYNSFISSTYNPKMEEIRIAENEIANKRVELDNIGNTIKSKDYLINSVKQSEYSKNKKSLENAKTKLYAKEEEYNSAKNEFDGKKTNVLAELERKERDLNNAKKEMKLLKEPTYSINTRRDVIGGIGYKIYRTITVIIDSLSNVFPVFLYFVAALVSLTTMTRFVDEERINSGTLKALGYSNLDVMKKFIFYGLISGLSGTFTGIVLGHVLLPEIIYNVYKNNFAVPKIEIGFYLKESIIAVLLSILSTVLPAGIVAYKELKEKPSMLLFAKSPAKGSKILLERLTFIWNKMSFTHKVTARNIFRYRKRMLMTIFGICGSVTLLFAGLSVQNSVSGINDRQFSDIIKYDLIVSEKEGSDDTYIKEIDDMASKDNIESVLKIRYGEGSKIAGKNKDTQDINIIVFSGQKDFRKYVNLVNRREKKEITLDNNGVVVSEKFAKILNLKKGDTFKIHDSDNIERTFKISEICEMYTGHFIIMNDKYYSKTYNKKYETNASMIILKDKSISNEKKIANEFLKLNGVRGVVQNTTLKNQIKIIVNSLNRVMGILITISSLLAVVILYNLTNINIAERIRELSTIKVLGFFDSEVTMYIYRETIILSIIGILSGYYLGDILYRYIIDVVPPDEVMFNPSLALGAFLIPAVLIIIVTVILGLIMNRKLSKVDMLGALKSVE